MLAIDPTTSGTAALVLSARAALILVEKGLITEQELAAMIQATAAQLDAAGLAALRAVFPQAGI